MSDDNEGFVSPFDNPTAMAAMEQILADDPANEPKPEIDAPADGYVQLAYGVTVDEKLVTEVEVRELTGEDEERLAKAKTSSDPTKFYNTILESGTVSVGGKDPEDVLPNMLVGDREALFLGIRKATYGPDVEMGDIYCAECDEEFEGSVSVDDVPVRPLKGETTFGVPLRKGGKATVRLPVGADQIAAVQGDMTESERNSTLLKRCVITLPQGGEDMPVAGFPSLVLNLGIADRKRILDEIHKRQPGPRYDEVVIEHECGNRIPVLLGMGALFPGL
jgi:hypothetical protein